MKLLASYLRDVDFSPNRIERARRAHAGAIDLTSSNPTQNGFIFPPDILRESAAPFWESRRYQPDSRGNLRARESISAYYAQRTPPAQISPADIFITASTSEAYSLLFALLTDPGDNVLISDVGYPLFDHLAAMHHVELRPYRLDESRDWQIDPETLRTDSRTRALILVSPHNPTGAIARTPLPVPREIPIICDEVFAGFTYAQTHTPPFMMVQPDLPVFVLNGISKMFALPDMKLGWIAMNTAAAKTYAEPLELLNDTLLGANALTQHLLPSLFDRGMPFVREMHTRIQTNLTMAIELLRTDARIHITAPDGGYYLFPRVAMSASTSSANVADESLVLHLLARGVFVHPGFFYGYESDLPRIMISCLTETSQLQRGIECLLRHLP
jgi:aspartate/methionine/tyrosine aminotransferase